MNRFFRWALRRKKPCMCGKPCWEVVNGDGELFVYGLTRSAAEHVASHLACKDGGWCSSDRYFAVRTKRFKPEVRS